jgi:hypothetical protein
MRVRQWSARQLILTLHEALLAVGEEIGGLWFVVVGLAILLGFPVVGGLRVPPDWILDGGFVGVGRPIRPVGGLRPGIISRDIRLGSVCEIADS